VGFITSESDRYNLMAGATATVRQIYLIRYPSLLSLIVKTKPLIHKHYMYNGVTRNNMLFLHYSYMSR